MNHATHPRRTPAAVLLGSLFLAGVAVAQDARAPATPDLEPAPQWAFRLTPYLWIPAQEGDVTVRGMPAKVDLSVGDTFDTVTDNFNFALALHAELQRDDLTFFGDMMYISLETDDIPAEATTFTARQDMGVFELGAAYRVVDLERREGAPGFALEPLVGARAHYLSLELDPDGAPSESRDKFWVDAIVGARAFVELHDHLRLHFRGDLGAGGSDFTWSALAGLDIAFGDHASIQLGYRALDTDYSDGGGADRFAYDVLLHGPYVAFTLAF